MFFMTSCLLKVHFGVVHWLSCPVVLSSSFFIYHHNFTWTFFSRINSINTNLISYSFLPFHLLPFHIFFSLFWIGYWSALPFAPNLQEEQLICHINKYFIYFLCWRVPLPLVYLSMNMWMTLATLPLRTYFFINIVEASSALITIFAEIPLS
jgi:hypothetical protein